MSANITRFNKNINLFYDNQSLERTNCNEYGIKLKEKGIYNKSTYGRSETNEKRTLKSR